jgi:hypothetical protein
LLASLALLNDGRRIDINMDMMDMTTSTSMRVNPRSLILGLVVSCRFDMCLFLF